MLALDLRSPVIVIGERNSILAEREMNPTREEGRARVFASLSLYLSIQSCGFHFDSQVSQLARSSRQAGVFRIGFVASAI